MQNPYSEELVISLPFPIGAQPDDTTCGPTCLHSVYRYFHDDISLEQVIREVPKLETGGALAVMLGLHALSRGYKARIYSLNLQVFDPTWFQDPSLSLRDVLKAQIEHKSDKKLMLASKTYISFLDQGGEIRFEDFTDSLIRKHLLRGQPILTGLSATYLYRCSRETGMPSRYDSILGEPSGHFVIVHGYDSRTRMVEVADPLRTNPMGQIHHYSVRIDRLVWAILLGIITYDANILILSPRRKVRK